jgi:hypothetical protein
LEDAEIFQFFPTSRQALRPTQNLLMKGYWGFILGFKQQGSEDVMHCHLVLGLRKHGPVTPFTI